MPVKLRLTGRDSFSHPLTYNVAVQRNQVILVRDEDAPALQALMNREADPDVAMFTTLVGSEVVTYDLTKQVNERTLWDGSVVIHPSKISSLPYRIRRGAMLRDGNLLPYGISNGVGGYTPWINNFNVGGADGISDLVAKASQQIFTTAGTFTLTPPAGATLMFLSLCGGGAGGGSGRRGAAASARSGGAGGGHGVLVRLMIPKEDWNASMELVIGAGGAGGAAVTANDTNGNNGVSGNLSLLRMAGATWIKANGGNAGVGGLAVAVATSTQSYWDSIGAGSSTTNITAAMSDQFASGASAPGCAGGSISAADAVLGFQKVGAIAGASPTLPTASGAAAAGVRRGEVFFATGGNGGAASITAAADAGGAGIYGSGGGGGGASLNGFNSGAGGRGGDGYAIVIWR